MASSGIRKDIWTRRGFNERMQYSEDDEYTRWCRAQGYRIAYCPASVVMHSHNYTPRQAYKRSFGEAWALAAMSNELSLVGGTPSSRMGTMADEGIRPTSYLLLGGGYGRGEGGVWRTPDGDRPYNDLEFYVCLRGSRHWNEQYYQRPIEILGEILTPQTGVHVEFKIISLAELARQRVSMFSYD